jgi:hypothetical protein
LTKLAEACLKVDWNSLPVERDPKTTEYKSYGSYGTYGSYGKSSYGYTGRNYYDDEDEYDYSKNKRWAAKPVEKIEPIWFYDNKYGYVSNIEINATTKRVLKVDLCQERKSYENSLIEDLLRSLDIEFLTTEWDGMNLTAYYKNGDHKTECDRNELIELLPELDYSDGMDLGEYRGENRNDYADNYGYGDDLWY